MRPNHGYAAFSHEAIVFCAGRLVRAKRVVDRVQTMQGATVSFRNALGRIRMNILWHGACYRGHAHMSVDEPLNCCERD